MNESPDEPASIDDQLGRSVRTLQFIHAMIMGGLLLYTLLILVRSSEAGAEEPPLPVVPLCYAIGACLLSFVVPAFMRRSTVQSLEANPPDTIQPLLGVFQTSHIIGLALLEGAGFVACVALSRKPGGAPRWFIAVPLAVLALMAARFPRKASVARWIATALETLRA